jgi:hypothetical protein
MTARNAASDAAGRRRGVVVCTVAEALAYVAALESESYLS